MKNIIFNDFKIKIVKNSRSKNMRLRVDKNGIVILTLPKWTLQKTGLKFLQQHTEWVQQQIQNCPRPKKFTPDLQIYLLDKPLVISHQPSNKQGCHIKGNQLIVSGELSYLHRRVRDFIKKQTYEYIQQKSFDMAAQLNDKPKRITLRDTSSRWGSCSSQKHLSFCWKLSLAPLYVLDYIIAHEVAHLKEMNHSQQFWATVAQLNVRRADAQIWLRKNAAEIQSWE